MKYFSIFDKRIKSIFYNSTITDYSYEFAIILTKKRPRMLKHLWIKLLKSAFPILGFVAIIFTDLGWKYNAVFVSIALLLSAIIYLLFELHELDHKKYLKVKGRVPGNGLLSGFNIIKIESNPKIPKDTLLTLLTKGNGMPNSICILKILESNEKEDIQAIQILPDEESLILQEYFADTNKLDNLYVSVIIKVTDLQTLKLCNNETI